MPIFDPSNVLAQLLWWDDVRNFFKATGILFDPTDTNTLEPQTTVGFVALFLAACYALAAVRTWRVYERTSYRGIVPKHENCNASHWQVFKALKDAQLRTFKHNLMGGLVALGTFSFIFEYRAAELGINAPVDFIYESDYGVLYGSGWETVYRFTITEAGMYSDSMLLWSSVLFGVMLLCPILLFVVWFNFNHTFMTVGERWTSFRQDMRPEDVTTPEPPRLRADEGYDGPA